MKTVIPSGFRIGEAQNEYSGVTVILAEKFCIQ